MICTRCGKPIIPTKGGYFRTKLGPHHRECGIANWPAMDHTDNIVEDQQSEITRLTAECERLRGEWDTQRMETLGLRSKLLVQEDKALDTEIMLVTLQEAYKELKQENSKLEATQSHLITQRDSLEAEVVRLDSLLREIEEHPDQRLDEGSYRQIALKFGYDVAHSVEAYRDCAEIAKRRHEK